MSTNNKINPYSFKNRSWQIPQIEMFRPESGTYIRFRKTMNPYAHENYWCHSVQYIHMRIIDSTVFSIYTWELLIPQCSVYTHENYWFHSVQYIHTIFRKTGDGTNFPIFRNFKFVIVRVSVLVGRYFYVYIVWNCVFL